MTLIPYKVIHNKRPDNQAQKGEGLKSLPPMRYKGEVNKRIKWNVYKVFKKKEYYYHTQPLDKKDLLIEKNINAGEGMIKVQHYNKIGH